jgi:hypothetical protein
VLPFTEHRIEPGIGTLPLEPQLFVEWHLVGHGYSSVVLANPIPSDQRFRMAILFPPQIGFGESRSINSPT